MNLLLAVLVLGFGDADPAAELPRSLSYTDTAPAGLLAAEPAPAGEDSSKGWWLGPRVGYIEAKDADDGTWLIGAQVRWHILSFLAVEASIDFHREEYSNGDVDVFTIPIQFSGIVYLPVDWKIRPYGIAGFGWYVTSTSFDSSLNQSDDTTSELGIHLGIGAEWELSPTMSLNFDFRYLFIDEPPHVGDANFDSIMLTIGLNFKLGG
jgi:opacity protein-like surface antigen